MNIDSIAKSDDRFPKPESNQILVADGFGYRTPGIEVLLPASLLACVMKPVRKLQFHNIFGTQIVAEAVVYQLPDTLQIAYNSVNPRCQIVTKRLTPSKPLFSVYYDRDYDRISLDAIEIVKAAGIDKIIPGSLPPQAALESFWRECQSKLKRSLA